MTQIILDTTLLRVAATCVSTNKTRDYLHGVYCVPAPDPETGFGVIMVATDGNRLSLVYDETGLIDAGRILATDWNDKALKATSRTGPRWLHANGLQRGKTAVGNIMQTIVPDSDTPTVGVVQINEIDCEFPAFDRVLPGKVKGETAVYAGNFFNAAYLDSIRKAYGLITGNKDGGFAVAQPEAGSPAWVWRDETPHVLFVVTPMRVDAGHSGPDFIDQALAVA